MPSLTPDFNYAITFGYYSTILSLLLYDLVTVSLRRVLVTIQCVWVPIDFDCETAIISYRSYCNSDNDKGGKMILQSSSETAWFKD